MIINKIKNYILIKKYPFLKPKNVWNEKVPKDYDYSYTELDMMPRGWKKSFGLKMIKELNKILKIANYQNIYMFLQIKEKWRILKYIF